MTPEKIYLNQDDGLIWHCRSYKDDIEYIRTDAFIEKAYIRTDAFIEKAEDFIRRKICDYIVHYNYGPNNDMETMYVDSSFFEDFKNYIKGE